MAKFQVIQAVVRTVEADSAEEAGEYARIGYDYMFRYMRADVRLLDRPVVTPLAEPTDAVVTEG